jgi:hypothetical protein
MEKRVMIAGGIEAHPLCGGGNTWAFLQYILGFRRLGFQTYYVEQLAAENCIDDNRNRTTLGDSVNARHFRTLMENLDLLGQSSLLASDGSGHVGLSRAEVELLARDVELLINMSGRLNFASVLRAVRRRMYLDMDPGFTQIWQEQYGVDMNLPGHDVYVTVGLNLGEPDCPLPTCGIRWEKTLPPVVIEEWKTVRPAGKAYSTIADWRGVGQVAWRGIWYGQKADEFPKIIDLPRRVAVPLELCLFIHPEERDRLELTRHGWLLTAPEVHAANADTYRDYVTASRGEFTAVKHGYAQGRTAWFSDRSACYLAAGRPVIMQDTGVSAHLPTGSGFLTFHDIDSAAEALARVETGYAEHAAAAASFAREFLDSDRVLSGLMRLAGV